MSYAEFFLAFIRLKTTRHSVLDVFQQLVNDTVKTDFDILFLRQVVHAGIDADVESSHNGWKKPQAGHRFVIAPTAA